MPQSFFQFYGHLIFSTKDRVKFIDKEIRASVHGYLATIIRDMNSKYVIVGGVEDHVHILFDCPKMIPVTNVVEKVKKESSKFIKTLGRDYEKFYWQRGYGLFSVGHMQLPDVENYILNQEEHHRHVSFQEEYRSFLERYKIQYNERYLWD